MKIIKIVTVSTRDVKALKLGINSLVMEFGPPDVTYLDKDNSI